MEPRARLVVERLAERLHAQLVETHISWVLLAGEIAWKVKKPLRLPFLDYSTARRRLHCCQEEVRLNERLAPALYLGVSRITGPVEAPMIDGGGAVLDYAVRMRRFPAGALFSERAATGTLTPQAIDRLAQRLAGFQEAAPRRSPSGADLRQRADAALTGAGALFTPAQRRALQAAIDREAASVLPLWARRAAQGRVREGHGDLHLANLLEIDGEVAAFDCIEFDEGLRCIDVVEDVAFTLMDLVAQGHPALGWRFFNGWLEHTGDHEGALGLRLCLLYRALVRAGVEHLRQAGSPAAARYAGEALRWAGPPAPALTITHGLPGSGKTFASQRLLEREGALRLRSDVERKRLHGLRMLEDSRARGIDIYTPEATERTYAYMESVARRLLQAGWPVVLDAAFLRAAERDRAHALARDLGVPFRILACEAPPQVLRHRLRGRTGDASEADEQVLRVLQAVAEPLRAEEAACVVALPDAAPKGAAR